MPEHGFRNLMRLPEILYERFHGHYKPTRLFDHHKEHPSLYHDNQIPCQYHTQDNLLSSHNNHPHRDQ